MVVLIFMFFLLLGGSSSVIPRSGIWMDIESKIRSYLVTKTVISAIRRVQFVLFNANWLNPVSVPVSRRTFYPELSPARRVE